MTHSAGNLATSRKHTSPKHNPYSTFGRGVAGGGVGEYEDEDEDDSDEVTESAHHRGGGMGKGRGGAERQSRIRWAPKIDPCIL
jgi:hypothetical protein